MKTEVVQKPSCEFAINIQLTENEARAWDAIVGYGWDAFIAVFEEKLGKHYIAPYKADAKRIFEHTRQNIGMQLYGIEQVKKSIAKLNLKGENEVVIK